MFLIKKNIKKTIKKARVINPKIIDKKIKTSSRYKFELNKYKRKDITKPNAKKINFLLTKLNFLSLTLTLLKSFLEDFFLVILFFTMIKLINNTL